MSTKSYANPGSFVSRLADMSRGCAKASYRDFGNSYYGEEGNEGTFA